MDMYTLLYLKWITNMELLYSIWNSARIIQQSKWEGSLGKNGYIICMAESLYCSPETLTTLLIGCTTIQKKKFFFFFKGKVLEMEGLPNFNYVHPVYASLGEAGLGNSFCVCSVILSLLRHLYCFPFSPKQRKLKINANFFFPVLRRKLPNLESGSFGSDLIHLSYEICEQRMK